MAREQEPGGMDMLILHLLAERDMYGYEMVTELAGRSNEVFQLKEGTLYPLLHALENAGEVASYHTTAPTGRERRYYRLTEKGESRLREKVREWRLFSQGVDTVLNAVPGLA